FPAITACPSWKTWCLLVTPMIRRTFQAKDRPTTRGAIISTTNPTSTVNCTITRGAVLGDRDSDKGQGQDCHKRRRQLQRRGQRGPRRR
ncbi:unnamed protein product, partial [Ectocarpus sp. 13 AM-2016]